MRGDPSAEALSCKQVSRSASEPWTPVETPAQGGWRFFKVGVEMR